MDLGEPAMGEVVLNGVLEGALPGALAQRLRCRFGIELGECPQDRIAQLCSAVPIAKLAQEVVVGRRRVASHRQPGQAIKEPTRDAERREARRADHQPPP